MVVRAGREFLAIPGPTTIPDEVLRAMHRPAVDIYSGPLLKITDSLLHDLSRVFRTKGTLLHLHRQWAWRVGSRPH
jgi:alanine-glyoxylate transaminase/serine-glyoxylate transaminase/serine-pyruvate transaminase